MTRDELYKRFGPILLEAIVRVMLSEINVLRENAGLQPRTRQQVIDAIGNELNQLSKYNWMEE